MADIFAGLMSGTSMDALDAVLVDFSGDSPRLRSSLSAPLPAPLRRQLLSLSHPGDNEIDRSARAGREFGEFSASVIGQLLSRAGVDAGEVRAIGSHGQTIRHAPQATPSYSVQLGDGNTIAQRTGITTVSDFRRRDMVVGGEGAPLMPAFHNALFRSRSNERVVLNLGGIANITILPAATAQPVTGFDTGPANVLMDSWCQQQRGEPFDRNGEWAASGEPDCTLLQHLAADPYFQREPPKSTGREYFNLTWLEERLPAAADVADIQATLCELTALTVARAVLRHNPRTQELICCGGGAYNAFLLQRLAANLPGISVHSSSELGVEPRWVEAMGFAWLARQTLSGLPGNLPEVTGACRPVILGAIHPA